MFCNFYQCNEQALFIELYEQVPTRCFFHASNLSHKNKRLCDFQLCEKLPLINGKCLIHHNIIKKSNTCTQCERTFLYMNTIPVCKICELENNKCANIILSLGVKK